MFLLSERGTFKLFARYADLQLKEINMNNLKAQLLQELLDAIADINLYCIFFLSFS